MRDFFSKHAGKSVMTRGVANMMSRDPYFQLGVVEAFTRFLNEDWGDICEEDKAQNDENPEWALGVYDADGETIWIKADDYGEDEHDIVITVLFPSEY